MNIDQLQPGRELDELICIKVMDYELMPTIFYNDLDRTKTYYCVVGSPSSEVVNVVEFVEDHGWLQYDFSPSTLISDAWQVVEKFKGEFLVRRRLGGTDYRAWIQKGKRDDMNGYYAHASTAPLAICLASLKAILGGESNV